MNVWDLYFQDETLQVFETKIVAYLTQLPSLKLTACLCKIGTIDSSLIDFQERTLLLESGSVNQLDPHHLGELSLGYNSTTDLNH